MADLWYFCAEDSSTVTDDKRYYARRSHDELAECMDIRATRQPPANAERIGGPAGDDEPSHAAKEVRSKHWKKAVTVIEAGQYDDHLDEIIEYDDRKSVTGAAIERQGEL